MKEPAQTCTTKKTSAAGVVTSALLPSISSLYISDIHLFHRRTPTKHIAGSLLSYIVNFKYELDYLVFGGDVFDRVNLLPEDDVDLVMDLISDILDHCYRKGIKLRVLLGTRSHDRNQSKLFVNINSRRTNPIDIVYIDKVKVIIEDDGYSHLYVPDNVHHDPDVVWGLVQEAMAEVGLEMVDFACMHGFFEYQIPKGIPISDKGHDQDKYLSIVRYSISIGHVHLPSTYRRIFAQGSFDILKFSEISKKGGMHVSVINGVLKTEFVENTRTYPYIKFNLNGLDHTAIMCVDLIKDGLKDKPSFGNVEITDNNRPRLSAVVKALVKLLPEYVFKKNLDKVVDSQLTEHTITRDLAMLDRLAGESIRPDTISRLVKDHAIAKGIVDVDGVVNELDEMMKEIANGKSTW